MKYSTYYNWCNAGDKEVSSEAQLLRRMCPTFIKLPQLAEHAWLATAMMDMSTHAAILERRRVALKRVRTMLEAVNALL